MSDQLTRASRVAVLALIVFLLASLLATVERNLALQRDNRRGVAALAQTQRGIVDKLTDVFETAQRAEDAARAAGTVPAETVASIVDSLKGYVDPVLVQRAVVAALKAARSTPGPAGPTGPRGPAGPAGAAATTSTVPASSTTTRPAPTTTTTRPAATTTTRCNVALLGVKIGCG